MINLHQYQHCHGHTSGLTIVVSNIFTLSIETKITIHYHPMNMRIFMDQHCKGNDHPCTGHFQDALAIQQISGQRESLSFPLFFLAWRLKKLEFLRSVTGI